MFPKPCKQVKQVQLAEPDSVHDELVAVPWPFLNIMLKYDCILKKNQELVFLKHTQSV